MQFEWDDAKSEATRAARGFGFEQMTPVFLDPCRAIFPDNRLDYGEQRWITFGETEGRLFAVAYTMRGDAIAKSFYSAPSLIKIRVRDQHLADREAENFDSD
ncbi:BrnT family toxin [Rhodophyticola sp. CCM32]|uniref:BrnT family toxin n=1 Tax=Rhodophyticola sp. CCM32 TaxID=2916397 RepID=UPI00107F008D|nr:BrnT family toxin [Rhodophyticola sp. CCM32]QBY02485.1 BrnT family toxin [Rhodophyticola sp. CCM32]